MAEPKLKLVTPLQAWVDEFESVLPVFLDAYCVVDVSGNIVHFNIAFAELVGESERKILKTGDFKKLIHFKGDHNPHLQILLDRKPIRLDEVRATTKAQPDLNLIVGGVPICAPDHEIVGTLITLRNVTAETSLQSKYDEKKKDSVTDGLTQMYNKKYMEESILRSIKNSLREGVPLTIIMSDIDHFKKVNDNFGHQAGDYVLHQVSQVLKDIMRETDVAGRFGGEEFIVLLNNCSAIGASIFCERFRKTIESTNFVFNKNLIPVTISQGTATFHQSWVTGTNPESLLQELIGQADSALYDAKNQGRNRVVQFRQK